MSDGMPALPRFGIASTEQYRRGRETLDNEGFMTRAAIPSYLGVFIPYLSSSN